MSPASERAAQGERQRLSSADIERSRARPDEAYAAEQAVSIEADLDPGTAGLLRRARIALGEPDLDGYLADRINGLVIDIEQAAGVDDNEQVELYCDQLIDVLMEVEG